MFETVKRRKIEEAILNQVSTLLRPEHASIAEHLVLIDEIQTLILIQTQLRTIFDISQHDYKHGLYRAARSIVNECSDSMRMFYGAANVSPHQLMFSISALKSKEMTTEVSYVTRKNVETVEGHIMIKKQGGEKISVGRWLELDPETALASYLYAGTNDYMSPSEFSPEDRATYDFLMGLDYEAKEDDSTAIRLIHEGNIDLARQLLPEETMRYLQFRKRKP